MRRHTIPLLFILSLFLAFATESSAQRQAFSVQAILPITTGGFSDGWGSGFGGAIAGARDIGDRIHLTYSLGYISFSPSSDLEIPEELDYSMAVIPVMAGFQYMFAKRGLKPFAIAEAGVMVFTFSSGNGSFSPGEDGAALGMSLGGGVHYEFSTGGPFAVGSLRYTTAFGDDEISYLSLNAGLGVGF